MSSQSKSEVWLVTGCSSGIGREIALAALRAGHKVVATARDAARVADLAAEFPGQALALALDITRQDQIERAVAETEGRFGRLDVLVNNAGYGYLAAIEEGEDAAIRTLFDTNFFGLAAMIRAVLPGMRARRSGFIINISSMTGLTGNPAVGYYAASKFAVEGLTEALAKELAPLNIRVSAVEPGAFRTDWAGRSMFESQVTISDYDATVGARRAFIKSMDGKLPGDPRKCGEAVVMLAGLDKPPVRLLLGKDVYAAYRAKLAEAEKMLSEWERVTLATDFDQ